MNKSDLIERMGERFPQLAADSKDAVNLVLGEIVGSLKRGQRVEIRGFGSFSISYRQPRNGRNPKTGDAVFVEAKHVPHFKAGRYLRQCVNSSEQSGNVT